MPKPLCLLKEKFEANGIVELFGVLAERFPPNMTGTSLVTPVVRFGCKIWSNISLDQENPN